MLYSEFVDKKDFIIYVDNLYKSDDFVKDIINVIRYFIIKFIYSIRYITNLTGFII